MYWAIGSTDQNAIVEANFTKNPYVAASAKKLTINLFYSTKAVVELEPKTYYRVVLTLVPVSSSFINFSFLCSVSNLVVVSNRL